MSTSNLNINLLIFSDSSISNAPLIRNADISYKLTGQVSNNPDTKRITLSPGETKTIYDGTRSTDIDNTTLFNVTRPSLTQNTYRFQAVSGTMPNFRIDRLPGITTATNFSITMNGPIATMLVTSGPFVTSSIAVGDIIKMDSGCGVSASNQGKFVILAKSGNTISFKNVNGINESFVVANASYITIYSNGGGSTNKIQIGDKVIISSGFSQSTFGTYEVTEVTPTYFEIIMGQYGGIPLETNIAPTASGLVFYSQAKNFIMIAAEDKISVRCNQDISDNTVIEAVEINNPEKPGLFIKNGTVYKLVINNLSIEPTTITYCTTE